MNTQFFSIKSVTVFIALLVSVLLFFVHIVFAGTLTNTSFSSTNNVVDETTTLTFEYTNETLVDSEEWHHVFRGNFSTDSGGAMFDFTETDSEDVTVTLDGLPATITEAIGINGEFGSNFYIRILENVDPVTDIVVIIDNVLNQSNPGEYSVYAFGTADGGATLVDIPEDPFQYILEEASLVLDGAGTLEDPYQLTQCYTITESGYYELQNNIVDVIGDCIIIEADDVFIDGAGFIISSDTEEYQENQAIKTEGYDRISISNITIDGFFDGIMLWDSEGESIITSVTVTNTIDDAIDLQGVSNITISESIIDDAGDDGIQVRAYDNEIDTFIASHNVTITDVDLSNIEDNGIEVEGVTGLVITNTSIEAVFDGDGINIEDEYNTYTEEDVLSDGIMISNVTIDDIDDDGVDIGDSQNIEIDNVTISNAEDGIYMEDVTGVDITNNEISDIDDEAINLVYVENLVITGNTITNVGNDGMWIGDAINATISGNTINATGEDGIDFSYDDDDNQNITITNNILTNIGDNGIELDEVYGATITGNSLQIAGDGIAVSDSADIVFSNNTITPSTETYLTIPENEFNFLALDIENAENSISDADDSSFNYILPFVFDFMGRDIVTIEVSTNGSIELLTEGEDCVICADYGSHTDSDITRNDVIFSSFDDLAVFDDGYVAVFYLDDDGGERVVVEFYGRNANEHESVNNIHIQTILYPNGTVEWNFNDVSFENYAYEMFTGVYDFEDEILYQAGKLINESGVGYSGDFSGNGEFELVEGYYENIGLDLGYVADSSFIGNSIRASQWVSTKELDNVVFNDNDSGNTYYLLNGAGAWTIFDITDSTGNRYADSGTNRPFSEAMLGIEYWEGEGQDEYPATENEFTVVATRRASSGGSVASRVKNLKDMGKDEEAKKLEQDFKDLFNKETPTLESLMKRVAELQALLAQLQGQPNPSDAPLVCSPLLKQGVRSPEVVKLQKLLNVQPQSGFFGPLTENAVRAFQTQKGIRVDGVAGPQTCAMF